MATVDAAAGIELTAASEEEEQLLLSTTEGDRGAVLGASAGTATIASAADAVVLLSSAEEVVEVSMAVGAGPGEGLPMGSSGI